MSCKEQSDCKKSSFETSAALRPQSLWTKRSVSALAEIVRAAVSHCVASPTSTKYEGGRSDLKNSVALKLSLPTRCNRRFSSRFADNDRKSQIVLRRRVRGLSIEAMSPS